MKINTKIRMIYSVFGYEDNPVYDDLRKPLFKFQAESKRELIGLLKTYVDNFPFAYIEIFKSYEGAEK